MVNQNPVPIWRSALYARHMYALLAGLVLVLATTRAAAQEPPFRSYEQAVAYVRATYRADTIDTRRSSWITSAEYYDAEGRGYLILGMRGKPYIFAGVPSNVWAGFKAAPSLGKYYNAFIRGRYPLNLSRSRTPRLGDDDSSS